MFILSQKTVERRIQECKSELEKYGDPNIKKDDILSEVICEVMKSYRCSLEGRLPDRMDDDL